MKNQIKVGTEIFTKSAILQLKQTETATAIVTIGITQGLKYNGDVKRGIKSGVAVGAVAGCYSGILNVVNNWDTIKAAGYLREV